MNIIILDYGSGNIKSVFNSFKYALNNLKIKHTIKVSASKKDIDNSSFIILPGVGSFENCINNLKKKKNLIDTIEKNVFQKNKPFLGICVGMQLLSDYGHENGKYSGLGWIGGEVRHLNERYNFSFNNLKIPHMGWNKLDVKSYDMVFDNISEVDRFYFVHSYFFDVKNKKNLIAETNYGFHVPAIIKKDNIYGFQFHPEKSGLSGQKIITNLIGSLLK